MKLLTRVRDRLNQYTVTVGLDPGETSSFRVGETSDAFEDMGLVQVDSVTVAGPQPLLLPGERILELRVTTLETVGRVRDILPDA